MALWSTSRSNADGKRQLICSQLGLKAMPAACFKAKLAGGSVVSSHSHNSAASALLSNCPCSRTALPTSQESRWHIFGASRMRRWPTCLRSGASSTGQGDKEPQSRVMMETSAASGPSGRTPSTEDRTQMIQVTLPPDQLLPPARPAGEVPWLLLGMIAAGAALLGFIIRSGALKSASSAMGEVWSMSAEETIQRAAEIDANGARRGTAEKLEKLKEATAASWSEVKPDLGKPKGSGASGGEDGDEGRLPRTVAWDITAGGVSSSSTGSGSQTAPEHPDNTMPVPRAKEWWEGKSSVTVVGYRDPEGAVEYLWMDVSLEEHTTDERFLAFEDKDDAQTLLAALRAIAAARGIPTPLEDGTTGHFHCLVSPENLRMLEDKVGKDVLVFRAKELALRVGMDEKDIRSAVIGAVFRRPRTSPSRRRSQQNSPGGISSTSVSSLSRSAAGYAPDAGAFDVEMGNGKGSVGDAASSADAASAPAMGPFMPSTSAARGRTSWWRRLPSVWVIQLMYPNSASGLFQCDVAPGNEEVNLNIIAFEDKAAAETVCGLSRKWTDLTANAVQATITSLSPPDLEMIADEVESGITILRSCDMKGLSPTMTPDELADMIMAATRI